MNTTRRELLLSLASALVWPRDLLRFSDRLALADSGNEQDYWSAVRDAFLIPKDRIYLNIGTLGPQPRVVLDAAVEHMRRVAMTYPPGVDWDELKHALGDLIDADCDGLVFPRNTTEAMNFVANGLELSSGDEVLTTTHEHIGGLCCWQLIAARRGVVLKQLPLPIPAESGTEIVEIFRRALTPHTRVISVSHINFTNGLIMPVREIIEMCRQHGIISVIDGAHPPGLMKMSIRQLDPDFYASSPHKWLMAAQGTGFLYMRAEWQKKLWPTLASGDWDNKLLGAQRFNHLGSFDESRMAGLLAAIAFHESIGSERIEQRARQLHDHLHHALEQMPGIEITSPATPERVFGMVAFKPKAIPALELQRRLATAANVRTRVIGEYDYQWMRLSPFIYNSLEELDTVLGLIRRFSES